PPAEKEAIDKQNAEIDQKVAELTKQVTESRQLVRHVLLYQRLLALPEIIRGDVRAAGETPADKRTPVQKYLTEKFAATLTVKPEDIAAALDEPTRKRIAEREQQIANLKAGRRSYATIQAVWDVGPPPVTYLHRRGGYETPGATVPAGFPSVLCDPQQPVYLAAAPGAATSGYRTALARWLGQPEHPLTSRVIVNRVWQQYFGRGIVSTPDNFGRSGAKPSHPELLDWLATEFVRSGWRFKTLHKLIMTSSVYRQRGTVADHKADGDRAASNTNLQGADAPRSPLGIDPENMLLWRMPLRRLESEIIRDSVLAVSGKLDRTAGGPPVPVKPLADGMVVVETQNLPAGVNPFRRSLYLVSRRNYQPTELSVFDQPLVATNCTRRTSAAVALQSLTMLNGQFATEQSELFAARVIAAAGEKEDRRINLAFRLALSRSPTAEEIEISRSLLAKQRERALAQPDTTAPQAADRALFHLCHMLLNSNEFLYVP
ncbi:MAG TPA: DUF1553 domain-containing protein, partial [Planctomycetaceae bacterium]|nr:DUF1553 domain-containing protein [Planctomycetaceae bacterium]